MLINGPHTDDEHVSDHPDLRDGTRDDDEALDQLARRGRGKQQQQTSYTTAEEAAAVANAILGQLPSDTYPHLAAILEQPATATRVRSTSGWI